MKIGKIMLLDSGTGELVKTSGDLITNAATSLAFHRAQRQDAAAMVKTGQIGEKQGLTVGGVPCAPRPFDIQIYAYATTQNTYHMRACRAKAKDIVGRAWSIVGKGTDASKEIVTQFFRNAFGDRTFGEGMQDVWTDYEALGNGYLEVIPNAKGQPVRLDLVPATEVYVRLDGLGFVQAKGGQTASFRRYGADEEIAKANLPATDPLLKAQTSLIHFSRYFPFSPFYGLPSIMPAFNALALMVLIREYNLQFFANNAVPDYAVILKGEWADGAEELIKEYFRTHLKGQAHKTLCLHTPEGGEVTFEPLASQTSKEGSFRLLWVEARDEVLHSHGIPPQKVGIVETGKLGGNLASEQMVEYKQSIVEPGQMKVASRFQRLIELGFGFPGLEFAWEPYDTDDRKLNADVDSIYLNAGVVTPNEVRETRFPGRDPLPGGDEPMRSAQLGDVAGLESVLTDVQQSLRAGVSA